MVLIICISCVKSKRPRRSRVEDLYTSPLFRMSLDYARSLDPNRVLVLSAKHGVLSLSDEVDPYEQTLNRMGKVERLAWADKVLVQLRTYADLRKDKFVFLAGQRYRENLIPHITHASVPMQGLAFGEQLAWLKRQLAR